MKKLFQWFAKNDTKKNEVQTLSNRIQKLEHQIKLLQEQDAEHVSPIQVENLHVHTIHVDKFEFNNNFGALGIKDLSGKLNIGANYGVNRPEMMQEEADDSSMAKSEKSHEHNKQNDSKTNQQGPKYNIKPRTAPTEHAAQGSGEQKKPAESSAGHKKYDQ